MPPTRFSFDPAAVQAGILVLPKDDYEFIVGEPRAFTGMNPEGKENYGIRVQLMVASEGEFKGKRILQNFYLHSEEALPMLKSFQLASFGFTGNDEKRFNEEFAAQNGEWDIDFASGTLGDFWRKLSGLRVAATADVVINKKTGNDQNQFRWRPV